MNCEAIHNILLIPYVCWNLLDTLIVVIPLSIAYGVAIWAINRKKDRKIDNDLSELLSAEF